MLYFDGFHFFCLVQVLLSVVAVSGPNTGRKFRCCANPVNQQCGYFAMSLFLWQFFCGLLTLDISWLFDCGDFLFLDSWPSHMGGTTRWGLAGWSKASQTTGVWIVTQCQTFRFTWFTDVRSIHQMFEAQAHHVISAGGFTMAQKRLWTKLWKDGASSTGRLTWHVFSNFFSNYLAGRMVSYVSVGVVHGVIGN